MIALLISTTFILSLILAYHHFLRPPSNLAPGIPIVPLWLSLLPLFRTWLGQRPVGQDVHFERYLRPRLERFGCVVFFFGGRWSVLFSHPVAIKAITAGTGLGGSSTDEFPKAGNHIKIPFAVISALTGANIISESGPTWARFRKVISPHLGQFDIGSISAAAECFVQRLGELSAERRRARSAVVLPVNDLVQRFTMQALLSSLFIRPVKLTLPPFLSSWGHFVSVIPPFLKLFTGSPPQFHLIHSQVKTQIFDPFFLTFPAADQWPWALLFPSRERARKLIQALEYEILQVVAGGQDLIQDDYHARGAAYSEDRVLSILDARAAAGSRPDKVGEGGNEGEEKEVGVAPITRSMLNATESGIWTPREMIDNAKSESRT
ncbi:cytochrome P450-dit2 [Tilletia horrida]|nr:cytochrome P450-dit2 [Tilletia horrida]